MKHKSYYKGLFSELYVLIFLKFKFYTILHWRHKNKLGEIDIIASKGHSLVAIEVKYRQSFEAGLYAISANQKKRIKKALTFFGAKYPQFYLRCDVCVVTPNLKITHLVNAF